MKKAITLAVMAVAVLLMGALSTTATAGPVSNPEMQQIYDADQADRSVTIDKIDWAAVGPRDAARRKRTQQLMAEGRLHSGADFLGAAYVFQHGDTAEDYLMAHTLAILAVRMGDGRGLYIAAATLDRYLQRIGQKQIYGTQTTSQGGPWTQEPYNRQLISDALRRELNVPDVAAQEANLQKMQAQVATPSKPVQSSVSEPLKCVSGPIDKVFLKDIWHLYGCNSTTLMVSRGGEPPASIMVYIFDRKVMAAVADGTSEDAEVKATKAAFESMTPEQISDLAKSTQAVPPAK